MLVFLHTVRKNRYVLLAIYTDSFTLKVHWCRFENLPICFCGCKNNILKTLAFLILKILESFTIEVCKFLKKQDSFEHDLLFPNICKQTFHISDVCISQKVKGILMWNTYSTHYVHSFILFSIIFILWRPRYSQIFKSALVYL